jgi:UDP-N-acetylglucosamine acyltransferase
MAIHPTAVIAPGAQIAENVEIGPYAVVGPHVSLESHVRLGAHVVLSGHTSIGEYTEVFPHAVLGGAPQDKKYSGEPTRLQIGSHNVFREFVTANLGTMGGGGVTTIGNHNLFMAYSHVAHDCHIGDHCVLANCASLAGHVTVHDNAILAGLTAVHQHSHIGRYAMLAGGAKVSQDVPPFTIAQGDRARLFGLNIVGLRRAGFARASLHSLRSAYRELFQQGTPLRVALKQVREAHSDTPEVEELLRFIEDSRQAKRRGICRSTATDPAPGE